MIIRSSSLFGLDHHMMICLIIAIALILVPASNSAPMYESDQTELENYGESTGCYYNYNHYGEGDRIMTNEPCLNCTCHDRMLMCYLRVCPFTKAIGQDCTIEKREDQCCPVITCPEVEVQLLDHQTTANPSNALGATSSSEVGAPDQYGCSINGRFYPEGAQVPSNPQKPCELCYCIRNMTTCVMQECTLHIDGCQPIYNKGVCCPVKYDCDHDKDSTPMLEDESTTTVRPTPGFILTTTVSPSVSTDCVHSGETYADGALIMTDKPCEHCYCMRGDIVCAVQECGTPLENEGKNCTALPPAVGQCCPDKYICDGSAAMAMLTTTVTSIPASADDDTQKQDEDQPQYDDKQPTKTEQESVPTQITQASGESTTTMATNEQKVQDVLSVEKEVADDDHDQQEQEHVAPQFEDVQTDDSHEEDDSDEQVPDKDDDEQRMTTGHPSVSEKPGVESDHIPGHEASHEKEENQTQEATTVVSDDAAAPLTTVRPDAQPSAAVAAQDETSTESHDDGEAPNDIVGTTVAPTQDAQEPEDDQVPSEQDDDEATSTTKPTADEIASSNEPTTTRNEVDISESAVTTSLPTPFVPQANADEKENEIQEHHDEATETNAVQHQPEHTDAISSDEDDEEKEHDGQDKQEDGVEFSTTTALPEHDEMSSTPETHAHVPSSEAMIPEQDKPEISTEKKEAAQKADDQPQLNEQDFVELPPAVVVTELPPIPTSSDEPSLLEQTPEPPKDEILPNIPLEADSHILSDAMTTEHAPTFGDRKEDDVQEPEQTHLPTGADMEEPVEMNTIIPLRTDEQKIEEPVNEENEQAHDKEQEHDVEHDQHTEDDGQSGEDQDHVAPGQDEVQTHATPVDEKFEDDQHVMSPDKLFPESIPGEGDCLIDGVTYENGANVPPSGKCQVACHCSNSIVHCEMVSCKAAPSEDCTPKSTISGECCPTYVCPKEATSTASSVSLDSTEASTESDADSGEEQVSADVSAESSESSTKAPVFDSQSTSTNEEDDESSQPSEAESDSAGFDVDDDVFKPLRPQEPSLDMHIDYFAGNRPTTANYEEEIILSTAAPTNVPIVVSTVTKHSTEPQKQANIPTDATPSAVDISITEQKEESTTLGAVAERGPEAEQDANEVIREQDEESQPTTAKTFAAEGETTSVPINERDETGSVQNEILPVDVTTSGAEIDNEQRVTSPAADEMEDDRDQIQDVTHGAANVDDEEKVTKPEHDSTTSSPTIVEDIDRDDEQERPVQTTVRSVEPTVDTATEREPTGQLINDIGSDDISSTIESDDKPAATTDAEDIPARETTTIRAVETDAEQITVTETKHKADDSTIVTTMQPTSTEQEEDRVQIATTTPTAALDNELANEDNAGEQQDKIELPHDDIVEPIEPITSKSVVETEQTTPYAQEPEAGQKLTTILDEEQIVTTARAVVDDKESDVPASVTVPNAMDEDDEDDHKTTVVTVTQKTSTVPSASDDSIIFRVDDDEEEPIVKPTLEEKIPSQDEVKPTLDKIKPTQDAVQPHPADREETDDDNLISPEQDGGFHFPQEEDDEAEEPIYKPSLDNSDQHVAMPLPVEIPQETVLLEPVDQIKEHDDVEESTTVHSDDVTISPSTAVPLKPEQDREQITHDDAQESNEIEADVHQIVTPIKKPEQAPMYDEIEENDQQTVAPTKHIPELTTVGLKQDTEPLPTTEKYDVSTETHEKAGDEQEQPTTTTHTSDAFDAKPAIEQHLEQDEKEDDTADNLPDVESIQPTTTRTSGEDSTQDEEQNATTMSPTVGHDEQVHDRQTTPSIPIHEDAQSEEDEENTQIHLDDNDENVPAVTTPQVSLKPESQDESDTEKDQVSLSDDQDESDDEDAATKSTISYDEVQTTTAADVDIKQTVASVIKEQSSTLAPVQHVDNDYYNTQKPDFSDIDSDDAHTNSEDDDDEQKDTEQQKETATKVPIAQAAADTSEEQISPTERISASETNDNDDSSSITDATLKDSEENQELDDDNQDEPTHTTLAPQITQDKKQHPESESNVTTKPADSDHVAPLEDDVDFEQEQQTIASPTTPQSTEDKEKQTTTGLPLDEDKLPESLSSEGEKMGVSTEQEVQTTTVRAAEFDFNAVDPHQEHPLSEPEYDDDRDDIAHSTTFATPEQSSAVYNASDKKPTETDSDESVSTDETANDELGKPDADAPEKDVPSSVPVTTSASVDDDDSQEDDDGQLTTVRPNPIRDEESTTSTTVASVPQLPELDETSEGTHPIDAQDPESTSETVVANVPESDDKIQESVATTDKPTAHDPAEPATTSEEEQDDVEQPQTDDLNADDDSSEEEDTPVTLTTTSTPVKATTVSDVPSAPTKDVAKEEVTFKPDVHTTVAPASDSQVTEHQTTVGHEDEPASTEAPVPYSSTTVNTQPAEEASQTTSSTLLNQDKDKEHTVAPDVMHDKVTVTTMSLSVTTALPTDPKAEEPVSEGSMSTPAQDDHSQSTVNPVPVQDDKLDERLDEKPVTPVQDEELVQKPQPVSDDSDEQQAAVKPTFTEDEDDDQQKVQEPEIPGLHDDGSASAKPTQQPETVGPSYGAPGQHYDTGYGHMPPHYPPSSYEDDYGEEEDPAAFGPGTCRYGGKLYVSAQQIPRDDPCDFCFCFRSDIICLQQSCPPPISGCNEEPIAGFCCPRYECPVSMATVLNVTTSTTTTTTTLPPHFLSHAYKGHVQKRGCQIQGKPYNVGETVASASGPCMRCTCGGDGQMQCEPKACSPEPMLQQMIAVAAARRR